jgi:hypothetical protein
MGNIHAVICLIPLIRNKDPKNTSSQQLYPTIGLHWILPKPFTADTTGVKFSFYDKRSETTRTDCDLCGKQFEWQSSVIALKFV